MTVEGLALRWAVMAMAPRTRRRLGAAVVVLLLGWLAAVAVVLLLAGSATAAGFDELDAAQRRRTFANLADPATGDRLGRAADQFGRAHELLANPLLAPVRLLPVVGRQVRAADDLAAAAADAAGIAEDATGELRRATAGPTPRGQARIDLLHRMGDTIRRSRARLARVDLGGEVALIGPLEDGRRRYGDARDDALEGLERAGAVVDGAARFLDGRTYLLLGANNAEMRAGSGMFLSASTLTTTDGDMTLGDVRPTQDLVLPAGVPVDDEVARNWPWLDTGRDFRNLGLTPRFPASAAIAARMWQDVPGGGPVDGVVALDVDALRGLLAVVGPVEVGGVRYTAQSVRQQLLHAQYLRFGRDQAARTDQVGQVARAVFDRIQQSRWEVEDMATALVDAAVGRHLLLWSSDRTEQAAWEHASVDGRLQDRSLAVSVVSRSANKLDWFVGASVTVEARTAPGGATTVRARITLDNRTPPGEPRYVAGPNAEGLAEGEYAGIVVVNAPGAATAVNLTGGQFETLAGTDGPTQVVGRYVRVARGARAVLELTFRLPAGVRSLVLEPTARVKPTEWRFGEKTWALEKRRTVNW